MAFYPELPTALCVRSLMSQRMLVSNFKVRPLFQIAADDDLTMSHTERVEDVEEEEGGGGGSSRAPPVHNW